MASNNRKPVSNKVKDRTATSKVVLQPCTLTSTHIHEHTAPQPHPTHILYSAVLGLSEYVHMRIKQINMLKTLNSVVGIEQGPSVVVIRDVDHLAFFPAVPLLASTPISITKRMSSVGILQFHG